MSKKTVTIGLKVEEHDTGVGLIISENNDYKIYNLQQERFDRIKHSANFPHEAISVALELSGLDSLDKADLIVIEKSRYRDFEDDLLSDYAIEWRREKKVKIVSHHMCHAANVFFFSGFKSSMVLIQDAKGSRVSNQLGFSQVSFLKKILLSFKNTIHGLKMKFSEGLSIYKASSSPFKIETIHQSYTSSTKCFGPKNGDIPYMIARRLSDFGQFGAGKVMGLAPYGKKHKFKYLFTSDVSGNGFFMDYSKMYDRYRKGRASVGTFTSIKQENLENFEKVMKSERAVISYEAQYTLENHMLHLAKKIKKQFPDINHLCISGGTALNLSANRKIADERIFDGLSITPSSDDSGIALGAAIVGMFLFLKKEVPKETPLASYLGPENDFSVLPHSIENYETIDDDLILCKKIVDYLLDEKLIGICISRSENGPRALGHRSLFCLPNKNSQKEMVNDKVKKREWWRPFSPICKADKVSQYFDLELPSPYMLYAAKAKDITKEKCPAIVHVDGSARVQTLEKNHEPFIYSILDELESRGIPPIILNTSFNRNNEPIVETAIDAYNCFLDTRLDVLVLGNHVFKKN